MATEKKATYKIYNGTDWDTIYFKTRSDQVTSAQYTKDGTTYYKTILDTQHHTVNNKHFGNQSGITLTASDISYLGDNDIVGIDDDIQSGDSINSCIEVLARGIQEARNSIPSGVLTTSNYGATLNSVYQPKHANLTSLAGLSTSKTGLIKITNGVASIDESTYLKTAVTKLGTRTGDISITNLKSDLGLGSLAYVSSLTAGDVGAVPTTRTVNGKALSSNITLYGSDLAMSSSDSTTVQEAINDLVGVAEGKNQAYSLAYNPATPGTYSNSVFNSQDNSITITDSDTLYISGGRLTGAKLVSAMNLKIGDVIYITNTNVPDRWVGAINSGSYMLYKMETAKVDLANYVTSTSLSTTLAGYSTTSHTHTTTLAQGGANDSSTITLAYAGKYKLTAGGTSVVFTMPTSENEYQVGSYSSGLQVSTHTGGLDPIYIPAPTTTHGGIVPAINTVSSQTQSTKFLREDGTWAAPSYTTNTDNDTKNTAGSTDTNAKIYLVGAASQAANAQTYSHGEVFVHTDHCIYSNSVRVRTIYYADSAPSGMVNGDIWLDTSA